MKVLLVDDSSTMRTIQRRCLNTLGVEDITEAANGRMAIDLFGEGHFDVVLTDWNIPVMNGLTFLKELRQQNTTVPVIMITTEAEKRRVVKAIEAGVSDYLMKPFTPAQLKSKLEKWVSLPVVG